MIVTLYVYMNFDIFCFHCLKFHIFVQSKCNLQSMANLMAEILLAIICRICQIIIDSKYSRMIIRHNLYTKKCNYNANVILKLHKQNQNCNTSLSIMLINWFYCFDVTLMIFIEINSIVYKIY